MSHYRTDMRAAVIALLTPAPELAGARNVLAIARVDAETVPCWSVSTPSEDETIRSASLVDLRTDLVVAASIKGTASTIEARLDDLSAALRGRILEGLPAAGPQNVQLRRTELKTGQEGRKVFGTVMMLFDVEGYLSKT